MSTRPIVDAPGSGVSRRLPPRESTCAPCPRDYGRDVLAARIRCVLEWRTGWVTIARARRSYTRRVTPDRVREAIPMVDPMRYLSRSCRVVDARWRKMKLIRQRTAAP